MEKNIKNGKGKNTNLAQAIGKMASNEESKRVVLSSRVGIKLSTYDGKLSEQYVA